MKPLVRAVDEYRLMGLISVAWGVVVGGVAAVIANHPLRLVASLLVEGAIFGIFMYLAVYGRYARNALKDAREISNPVRARPQDTRRWAAVRSAYMLVPLTAFSVFLLVGRGSATGAIGIIPGGGACLLVISRQIRRWESEHRAEILREPRWRWRREHGRRGRGVIDPQDFYYLRNDGPIPGSPAAGPSGTLPSHG
jgi:hypothetical protein